MFENIRNSTWKKRYHRAVRESDYLTDALNDVEAELDIAQKRLRHQDALLDQARESLRVARVSEEEWRWDKDVNDGY